MSTDLKLGIIDNLNYDLTLTSNDVISFGIISIIPPTTIVFSDQFIYDNLLNRDNIFSLHFRNFAPEPLYINKTYNFRLVNRQPFESSLILDENMTTTLNGNFNPNANAVLINKDFELVTSSRQVIQKVLQRVNTIKGEWLLNTQEGLPWFDELLGSKGLGNISFRERRSLFEVYMKQLITETEGVRGLVEFRSQIDRVNRNVTFTYRIETDFNTIENGILGFDIPFGGLDG